MCGVEAVAGTNPTTAEWQPIFALVAGGPAKWGNAGPGVADIGQGCGKPMPTQSVPATFPCELLKAIAMQESGWRQFCVPTTPGDEAHGPERTIISFDCGYGVGQVTSGMHIGETPGFDRARVASDPTYDLATGTQILAAKWRATKCVGDNQPAIIEDWYTAVWAYNGLAYVNNPSNPNLDAMRGVWDPAVGGAYAYQERVFGWVEHPPSPAHWTSIALAYPNRADVGTSGAPPDLPEPDCASPTDCTHKRGVHTSLCGSVTPPPDMTAAEGPLDMTSSHDDLPAKALTDGDVQMSNVPDAAVSGQLQAGCACAVGSRGSPRWCAALVLGLLLALRRRRARS